MYSFDISDVKNKQCPISRRKCTIDCGLMATLGVVTNQECECGWKENISVFDSAPLTECPKCQIPLQSAGLGQIYICNLSSNLIYVELQHLQAHIDYFRKFNLSIY